MTLPTLYARSSKGLIKVWTIGTDGADIVTQHGYEGGAITESRKTAKPKNVGRANATTAEEQAASEAQSKWTKQRDQKGYVEDRDAVDEIPLRPMLAHPFEKRKHLVCWPAYAQPKLDGTRCLAIRTEHGVDLRSRNGKPIETMGHIASYLAGILEPGQILDGELFTQDLTFQEIISGIKKAGPLSHRVGYWVYDAVSDEPFEARHEFVLDLLLGDPCLTVPTALVRTEAGVERLHGQWVGEGFEGTIVRNAHGLYARGHRSVDLLKRKDFLDAEFEIIGGREGEGKDAGTIVFRCRSAGGDFDCRPRGTHEQRAAWFQNLAKLVGTRLTVRYQKLSDDGIPIFPVGIAVRDYE